MGGCRQHPKCFGCHKNFLAITWFWLTLVHLDRPPDRMGDACYSVYDFWCVPHHSSSLWPQHAVHLHHQIDQATPVTSEEQYNRSWSLNLDRVRKTEITICCLMVLLEMRNSITPKNNVHIYCLILLCNLILENGFKNYYWNSKMQTIHQSTKGQPCWPLTIRFMQKKKKDELSIF